MYKLYRWSGEFIAAGSYEYIQGLLNLAVYNGDLASNYFIKTWTTRKGV
jgi:hypothetical protein